MAVCVDGYVEGVGRRCGVCVRRRMLIGVSEHVWLRGVWLCVLTDVWWCGLKGL